MERLNQTGAGKLEQFVAFDKRLDEMDEYGNFVAAWVEQFRDRAQYIFLRGSEQVMAARLESRDPMVVRIRISNDARRIGIDWRMRDLRNADKEYNINDITLDNNRAVVDLLVTGGGASG